MGVGGENREGSSDGVDRRRLLKGAVAAGVGVAAWSAPSITSLGGTPVYAAVCTAPLNVFNLNVRNTDCGGCTNSIRFKDWTTNQCPIDNFPPGAALAKDACGGAVPPSGLCPPNAGVCVGGVPSGQTCVVRVIVQENNCGGTAILSAVSAQFSGATWVALPGGITCQAAGGGNLFTRIQIVCSRQPQCLPTN